MQNDMTMLGASVLFMRGGNIHNQLSQVVKNAKNDRYTSLLTKLNLIYELGNTQENREKLQRFIIDYGEEIYREFSRYHLSFGGGEFGYDLK